MQLFHRVILERELFTDLWAGGIDGKFVRRGKDRLYDKYYSLRSLINGPLTQETHIQKMVTSLRHF